MSWTENVRKVVPYVPGEQPKLDKIIKLNTNENPYGPSPKVIEVLKNFDTDVLRKYPDPNASDLVNAIADYHNVTSDRVFVGVGSDDVLSMAFLTYFNSDLPVLFPDITYSFYDVWANLYRIPFETKKLRDDLTIDASDYDMPCGGIIIPNPNAPTGVAENVDFFENIIKKHPECVVIIDEAYVDFGAQTCLPLTDKYDNILVVRTYSKSRSMAGSRIGYAIGSPRLIKYLLDCKFSFNSYTMDSITIASGVASIKDEEYFADKVAKVIATRERVKPQLREVGFAFAASKSHFIFATHKTVDANIIFEKLKASNIFVRHFKNPSRIDNYLRISIGTEGEMDELIKVLKEIL